MASSISIVALALCLATVVLANKPAAEVPNVLVNVYSPTQAPFKFPTMPSLRLPSFPTMRPFKMPTLPPFKMPTLPSTFYVPYRAQMISRPTTVTLPPMKVPEKLIIHRQPYVRPTMPSSIGSLSPIKIEYQDAPLKKH